MLQKNKNEINILIREAPTFAQETAITIFAPDFAIPFASDLEPTYQMNINHYCSKLLPTWMDLSP
jgi:hypothetical protein